MADWDRNADWNRDVLERIVALLFALAGLADRAAGAPVLRRREVLGVLMCGEAEARAFVIGMATGAPALADMLEPSSDLLRLAASFRALALILCALLAQARLSAPASEAGPRSNRQNADEWPGSGHWAAALPTPDTS